MAEFVYIGGDTYINFDLVTSLSPMTDPNQTNVAFGPVSLIVNEAVGHLIQLYREESR